MLYKNISRLPQVIMSNSKMQEVAPGHFVDLTVSDLKHVGYAVNNFEAVHKTVDIANYSMLPPRKLSNDNVD